MQISDKKTKIVKYGILTCRSAKFVELTLTQMTLKAVTYFSTWLEGAMSPEFSTVLHGQEVLLLRQEKDIK